LLGAQEESLFRRTNYCQSLLDARAQARQRLEPSGAAPRYPMDKMGGIYSPGVLCFRSSEATGYGFVTEPQPLSFVAAAALQKPRVVRTSRGNRLSPADAGKTKRKLAAVLSIGLEHGHDCVVLSAFGCGAFENPPTHVAQLCYELLMNSHGNEAAMGDYWRDFKNKYKHVVFAIIEDQNSLRNPGSGNLQPFQRRFSEFESATAATAVDLTADSGSSQVIHAMKFHNMHRTNITMVLQGYCWCRRVLAVRARGVSERFPFDTGCPPLSYSGNPGVKRVILQGGVSTGNTRDSRRCTHLWFPSLSVLPVYCECEGD
jgi:uncharacterized protein (TIGR02452 family)